VGRFFTPISSFFIGNSSLPAEDRLLNTHQLEVPVEAEEPLTIEDWAVLLERYGLDILKVSPEPDDHKELAQLKNILLPFGFTLTEKGICQSRSAGDLVLTFSESKDRAVAHIMAVESRAMGDRLRAMVVTDFEKMSSGINKPRGSNLSSAAFPLDRDAGSALRLFRYLVDKSDLAPLHPVLVTGNTLMVATSHGSELLNWFNAYLSGHNLRATCRFRAEASASVREVSGEGHDWSSRTYVAMITAAFEQGVTRCLVGTRGIFGEGWDSLSLNTLIDLTSVTTSTAVQQLRGRSIRKDPSWPRKVAHNWDVICVAPNYKKGDADLKLFVQRHARYWGIVPPSNQMAQFVQDAKVAVQSVMARMSTGASYLEPAQQSMRGQIVKGITHVSPELAYQLAVRGFAHTDFEHYNRLMFNDLPNRNRAYDLWNVGGEYSNFVYSAARLDVTDLKIRTVFTVEKMLKRMLHEFWLSIVGGDRACFLVWTQLFLPGSR
jgi:hypothetical protein